LDADDVFGLHEIVKNRTVEWLEAQDFDSPWQDKPLQPLRKLCEIDPIAGALGYSGLQVAVENFVTASAAFLDAYDRNTRPDELMVDGAWREVGPPAPRGETQARDVADGIRAQLVGRAADTIEAWDVVLAIEAQTKQRTSIPRHPWSGSTK
jgi:hypothetical protein